MTAVALVAMPRYSLINVKKTEDNLEFVRYHPAAKRSDGEKV